MSTHSKPAAVPIRRAAMAKPPTSSASNPQTCCAQHTNGLEYRYQVFQLGINHSPFGE